MKANYPENVYVQHDAEISNNVYIEVALDMFDNAHDLPFDALARAQYKHWCVEKSGAFNMLTPEDRDLLEASGVQL